MEKSLESQIIEELATNDLSDFAKYLGIDLEDIENLYDETLEYDDVSV